MSAAEEVGQRMIGRPPPPPPRQRDARPPRGPAFPLAVSRPVERRSIVMVRGLPIEAAEALRAEIADVAGHDEFVLLLSHDHDSAVYVVPAQGGPLRPPTVALTSALDCPHPDIAGRQDQCGLFAFPQRCTPDACSMVRS